MSGQFHAPATLPPGTHWIGGWVDPRAGLHGVKKRKFLTLSGLKLQPLDCPSRSQLLYRLRYPGSQYFRVLIFIVGFVGFGNSAGIYLTLSRKSHVRGNMTIQKVTIVDL
jgi:hypothetical protein